MQISSLRVSQFRNLESQDVLLSGRVVLVCGENGQGKTSLLESIYTTAHARSFRSSKLRELVAWGKQEARVALKAQTIDGSKELECRLTGGKKQIYVNGNQIEKASAYYGQVACIAFTPESMQLVQGGPAVRRRFIDRSVSMIDARFVEVLVQYQRALKSRNQLLLAHRHSQGSFHTAGPLRSQFEVWEQLLARYGTQIIATRMQFIEELEPILQRYFGLLSRNREFVEFTYQSSVSSLRRSLEESPNDEQILVRTLEQKRVQDSSKGSTSIGPHRDELQLVLNYGHATHPARETASQGQARTLALSLTLSVMELITQKRGEPPVVLLDDVESELDLSRRAALFEVLDSFQSQTILSATQPSDALKLSSTEVRILRVEAGKVTGGEGFIEGSIKSKNI